MPRTFPKNFGMMGNEKGMVSKAAFPQWEQQYVVDSVFEYPIQINRKGAGVIVIPSGNPRSRNRAERAGRRSSVEMDGKESLRKSNRGSETHCECGDLIRFPSRVNETSRSIPDLDVSVWA